MDDRGEFLVGTYVPGHIYDAIHKAAEVRGVLADKWIALALGEAVCPVPLARPATAEDVRLMIREEIRAALREERDANPLLHATHCHTGAPRRAG